MGSINGILEIRWHGRGGQGAISSARVLAQAAFLGGYRGVTSAPSFGAERRGAPVTASTRLSPEPIRILSHVEMPSVVIVLDDTLVNTTHTGATCAVTDGIQPGGWIIVNSAKAPEDLGIAGDFSVAASDATAAALEVGLVVSGSPMVNTAMLGAVARATELIGIEQVQEALARTFPAKAAGINFDAARLTFERCRIVPNEKI